MVPDKAVQVWAKFTSALHTLLILPYEWNKEKNSISISSSHPRWHYIAFLWQLTVLLSYEAFLLFRGYQELTTAEKPMVKKIELLYWIGIFMLMNIHRWVIWRNFEHYPAMFQNFARLCRMHRGAQEKGKIEKSRLHYALIVIIVGCAAPAIARILSLLKNPRFPAQLTSLHPTPTRMPFYLKALAALVHLQINAFHNMTFAFNLVCLLCYNVGIVNMIKELRIPPSGRISPVTFARRHLQLSVLQAHYNSVISSCTLVLVVTTICVSTINLFQGLAYGSIKGLIVGTFGLVIAMLEFENFATVHSESMRVLHTWKSVEGPKWFLKYRRSCRPLAVNVGRYFFADQGLLLTILSIVMSTTANLVLTFYYE